MVYNIVISKRETNTQENEMTTNWMEEIVQEKVNEVAKILIAQFPEIAQNEPKRIGKMARMMVLDAAEKATDIICNS